jgi:hypothetical protein
MQYEAAKPKGVSRNEDAPKQEPMRGSDSQVRRNPSTDQKKVRRQMAKKSAYDIFFANSKIAVRGSCINCGTNMLVPEDSSFPKCDNCTKNDPAVGTPDRPYDREKDPGFTGSRKTASDKFLKGYAHDGEIYCTDCHGPETKECEGSCGSIASWDSTGPMGERCSACGKEVIAPWYSANRKDYFEHYGHDDWYDPDLHVQSGEHTEASRKTAENENPWWAKLPTWTQIHGLQHGESMQFIGPDGVEHNISYHEHVPDNDFGNKAYGYKAGVFTVEGPKGTQYHRVSPFQEHETSQKRYAADDVYHTMMRNFRGARKTPNNKATSSNKNATLIPTQVQNLTPQDYILHPITQGNEKIRRTRSFETQSGEAYVDTDSGTSSPVKRNRTVVRNPYNMSQIELPSTGIPGGNSNVIPFGRQHDPLANKPSAEELKCPRDGTMMTLQKGANDYKCSTCGFVEKVPGAGGLKFSDAPSVNKAAIKNNRRTASAIAQRARQVLDLEENQ